MEKGKIFTFFTAMAVLLTISPILGLPESSQEKLGQTEDLRKEIRLLNLINGLDLTQEQMEIVLANARENKKLRDQFEKALLSKQEEIEVALDEVRSYLRENKEIPPQTVRNYRRLDREVREARLKIQEGMKDLTKEIEESLEPHQLYQLQEFVPCIIPPKGEKRIGQAKDHKGLTRNLERIRRAPSRLYLQNKKEIVGKTLEGLKLHAPLFADINDEEMERRIESIYDDARNLEDAEFEIQKEQLAEDLISPFKPQAPSNSLMRKIAGFLLSAEVIPVLERRIEKGNPTGR
jgi:hypothetical protein